MKNHNMAHRKHTVLCENEKKLEMLINELKLEFTEHHQLPLSRYVFETKQKHTEAAHFYNWEHDVFMQDREGKKTRLFKISASQNHLPDRMPCALAARHSVHHETKSQKMKRRKTSTKEHYIFIQGSKDGIQMWDHFVRHGNALEIMADVCGIPVFPALA